VKAQTIIGKRNMRDIAVERREPVCALYARGRVDTSKEHMSSSGLVQIDGLSPIKKEDRKTSKVMLLFPPEWVPTAPYLALPSLTAVLREAGHTVVQRDINIEMYDHFFTMEFLIWVKGRLGMQLKPLQDKEKAGRLTEQEAASESGAGRGLCGRRVRPRGPGGRREAGCARRTVLRRRKAGAGAEYVPRSDAVHLRRLLSGLAGVLSHGK
jgi:hypothetical protein